MNSSLEDFLRKNAPRHLGHLSALIELAQDEAARLDAGDLLHLQPGIGMHQFVDRPPESTRIAEQRGDVAEQDAGFWIVGNRPDGRKQRVFESGLHARSPIALLL